MSETQYRNRRAAGIENDLLQVTVTVEGGHVAEILDKRTGVNPLWSPPWPSIEPSTYNLAKHPEYGHDSESKLLAGILGHNLCMDFFGAPSAEEAAAGLTVHGEASVAPYAISVSGPELVARAEFPVAQLRFERRMRLDPASRVVRFTETVENLSPADKPTAWTEHVTLGPPFLERGATQFRATATRSMVAEDDFSGEKGFLKPAAVFDWPHAPRKDGGTTDLRVYTNAPASGEFTTHLMDPRREQAFFMAWSPATRVLFGYVWKRADFPWLGIWEENCSRPDPPWNGKTLTRGMEFGASPVPETRRQMIDRGSMFGVPGFRWIPAKKQARVEYCAFLTAAPAIPESVAWDGRSGITLA